MTAQSKTALITGATSGFGKVIAEHLVRKGYRLMVFGRSQEKMHALNRELDGVVSNADIINITCDLSSLQSVVSACEEVKSLAGVVDLVVLNAGIWNPNFKTSSDGIEETLQVNLLAPVLTVLKLKELQAIGSDAKIIFTCSALHQGTIQFEDIEFKSKFSGFKAYRQSKLGIILITRLFATLPEFSACTFISIHPGMIKTDLGRNAGWFSRLIFKLLGKSLEEGAKTHIHVIDTPTQKLVSGEYYAKCQVTQITPESNDLKAAKKLLDVIYEYLQEHGVMG